MAQNPGAQSQQPEHSRDAMSGAVLLFDLGERLEQIRSEPAWEREHHGAIVLVKEPELRVTLVALDTGTTLRELMNAGPATIQVIEGSMIVRVQGQRDLRLQTGEIVSLGKSFRHEIEGLEECAFLLTMHWKESARTETSFGAAMGPVQIH